MAMIFGRVLGTDGAVFFYMFLQTALLAGATVTASGDGLAAYSAVGNVITSAGTGVGGLGNTGSWFVLSWGTEQWCVQRSTVSTQWRVTVSPSGGYSGGTAAVCQASANEVPLVGGGTNLVPVYASFFNSGTASTAIAGVDNAAPRRAYLTVWETAGTSPRTYLFRDIVAAPDPSDADPVVRGCGYYGTGLGVGAWGTTSGTPSPPANYHLAFPPSATAPVPGTQVSVGQNTLAYVGTGTSAFPGNTGTLSISGADPLLAPFYARWNSTGSPVLKGFSTLFLVPGPTRATGSTLDVAVANDRVVFNGNSLPWNGTIP